MGTLASRPTRAVAAHRRRLRLVVITAVSALGISLSGCSSGFDAQTIQPYQPADGVSNRESSVYAINTLIVTDGQGNGTVVTALINQGDEPDALVSVTATGPDGEEIPVAPLPRDGIVLPSEQIVQTADAGNVQLSADSLRPGRIVTLSLEFAAAAPVEVEAPVLEQEGPYADVPVGPVPGAP